MIPRYTVSFAVKWIRNSSRDRVAPAEKKDERAGGRAGELVAGRTSEGTIDGSERSDPGAQG